MRIIFLTSLVMMLGTSCDLQGLSKKSVNARTNPAIINKQTDDATAQGKAGTDTKNGSTSVTLEEIPASKLNWDGKTLGETPSLYIFAVE